MSFSGYIVYADESGDHSLTSINPQNPVFVLAFCIFEKVNYSGRVVPEVQGLKFEFWGHDGVVLHSHDIRKARGDFRILQNAGVRGPFLHRLNGILHAMPLTIIGAVIDKQRHVASYVRPDNPYEIALTFCMERLWHFMREQQQIGRQTHVLVERRGQREDAQLELEFRRIIAGRNAIGPMPDFEIRFMDKKHNSTGLQVADLVAHPIGRHVINPAQPNQAFATIHPKLRRSPTGVVDGFGLKIFP